MDVSSKLVVGVRGGSFRFIGMVGVGGRADDTDEGVAAGVMPVEEIEVE